MKNLLLVDGNSILFRAYYATVYGTMMSTSNGIPTNAVFGFIKMIDKAIDMINPDAVLVAWDSGKPTFRHKEYEAYKGTRKELPSELIVQFPIVREYLDAYGMYRYECDGIEADDIIGTCAKTFSNIQVHILSSDKDLLQLIDDTTDVYLMKKGISEIEVMNANTLMEKMSVTPKQIIDLKGLMGDSADNIPGVKGVGEKTAVKLLQDYQTLENVYLHIDEIKGKLKEKLENDKENAFLSKHLATIITDAKLPFTIEHLKHNKPKEELNEFFIKYEMNSFVKKTEKKENQQKEFIFQKVNNISKELLKEEAFIWLDYNNELYEDITLFGLALSNGKKIEYIDIEDVLKDRALLNYLKKDNQKIVYDAKMIYHLMKQQKIDISYLSFDMMIATFLLDATLSDYDKYIQAYHFNNTYHRDDVYGKRGKIKLTDENERHIYVKEQISHMIEIYEKVKEQLKQYEMWELFENIEMPLTQVLFEMEENGVTTDLSVLAEIAKETEEKINKLSFQIYDVVGHEFNINSPKQLAVVLFDELGLKANKKRSTAVDVLEKLRKTHPIIDLLMEQRKYQKLYSTYAVGLSKHVRKDGKIHTVFNQTLTQTGRLSSSEPNLQNISVRDEEGKEIRKAFVASGDCVLLSADYSQIELRMLAHMADEHEMIDAFHNNIDIHTKTAMQIFDVKQEEVTSAMRRQAKTVNFGIVYGQSDFGLSEQLQISRKEAHVFIEKYFESYPNIKTFMDQTIENCIEKGYVTTLFHRRRTIKEINDKNYMIREFGKRAAMNAPIQGSAADLIKLAMVRIYNRMKKEQLQSKMILQIHDELIFDVKKEELEKMKKLVEEEMEHALELKVPLVAQGVYGASWYDAK